MMTKRQAEMTKRFKADVKNHVMTVAHDDGLYRHLEFRGKRFTHWFDIVTWPGVLMIRGDYGTFAFSRVEDMMAFFREPSVNWYYWTQKLIASDRPDGFEEFSEELFTDAILRQMAHHLDLDGPKNLPRKLAKELREKASEWACEGHHDALRLAMNYEHDGRYPFSELWDCTLKEHTHGYIWCLNAVHWGVREYDSWKAAGA